MAKIDVEEYIQLRTKVQGVLHNHRKDMPAIAKKALTGKELTMEERIIIAKTMLYVAGELEFKMEAMEN